ncbi:conjugal transfer protein [Enemella dayhoffiae]|nr:conjugal transfer protein [Enemella dayhoffiae]
MTERRDGFPRPATGPGSDSPRPGDPGYAEAARAREGGGEDSTVLRSSLRQGRPQGPGRPGQPGQPPQPAPRRTSEDHWAPPAPGAPANPNPHGIRSGSARLPAGYAGAVPPGPPRQPGPVGQPPMSQASAPMSQASAPMSQASAPMSQASAPHHAPSQPPASQPPASQQTKAPLLPEVEFDEDDSVPRGSHRVRTKSGYELVVPLPGRRLSDARSTAKLFRTVAVTALVLSVLGAAVLGGFLAVLATRGMPTGGRTQAQVDTFNADAAAVFGGQYLRACLARSGTADDQNRVSTARAMSTVEDPACAGGTDTKPRRIDQVIFNGTIQSIPGMTRARYVGFLTTGSDGAAAYLVPIYLDDPATGAGPRVTGSIGQMPIGGYGQPVGDEANPAQPLTDLDLAAQMKSSFLPEFMSAWTASADSLPQFLTPRASEPARTGLRGGLRQVQVTDVLALPPKSAHRGGQNFEYANGTQVTLQVQVSAASQTQTNQPYAYRVVIEQNGGKWFVADVQAGIAKVPSGTAPTQTIRPSRTATPTSTGTPTGTGTPR